MRRIKSFILKLISLTGYNLYKKEIIHHNPISMDAGLRRMHSLNINPGTVIDVGAAEGKWAEMAMTIWPKANFKLVEPLAEQADKLAALKLKHPNLSYNLAVAGEQRGETFLNVSPDLDGSGIYGDKNEKNAREVPVITLDEIVQHSAGSIMIKLDTHGYEVPILKGASEVLKRTDLLVIEVYGFYISPTCLLFHELSGYLFELGFRLIDVVDIMRRPGDSAFWQADAFYIRKDHPVFERNSYA